MNDSEMKQIFPSAQEDARAARVHAESEQTLSPSYRLAYDDPDFLERDELLAVRLQLELMKADMLQQQLGIRDTVVVFGSTRIPEPAQAERRLAAAEWALAEHPDDPALQQRAAVARRIAAKTRYYAEAVELGRLVATAARERVGFDLVITTGGGPGLMEAANRGAHEAGAHSVGHNIVLPYEQRPNRYISPELCFQFHYFAIRKMHFLLRARALVAFPGGFGTLDELFDALTLIQTRKVRPIPLLLFGREFWERAVGFDYLVAEGTISPEDAGLFRYVESAAEAFERIAEWYLPNSRNHHGGGAGEAD